MRATKRIFAGALVAAACGFGVANAGSRGDPPPIKIRFTTAPGAPSDYGNQGADDAAPAGWLYYGSQRTLPSSVRDFALAGVGGGFWATAADPLCFHVVRGRQSAFACGFEIASPTVTIGLDPSTAVWGRVTGHDGAPVANTDVGLLVHGARHVHPFTTRAEADGSFRLPDVPASLLRSRDTELFATAPGWPDLRAPLPAEAGRAPLDLRLPAGRRVRARLVGPAKSEMLTLSVPPAPESRSLILARPDELDLRVAYDTRRIVFVPPRLAAFTLDLPATPTDVDLGDVALVAGAAVTGRVHGARGPEIVDATVCVFDDASCVRVGFMKQHGCFEAPNVGAGEHRLRVRIVQSGETFVDRSAAVDHVVAGGPPVDVLLPAACVGVDFRGEDGKPLGMSRATVVLSADGAEAGEPHRVHAWDRRPRPIRLEFDAPSFPGRFRLVVRSPGYQTVETTLDVDAKGAGNVAVVLRE